MSRGFFNSDLGRMFQLVSRLPDNLGEFKSLLEQHIQNQGLAAIETCDVQVFNDPKLYVKTILSVHKRYSALVADAFNNEAGFVAALDKVKNDLLWNGDST